MKTILEDKKKDAIKKLVQLVPLPEHVESVIIKPMLSRYTNTNTNLRNGFIFCPFHPEVNEPSFSWHRDKNFAYCFGCKKGGDVVMLHYLYLREIVRTHGVTYNDAIIDLANMYHITIPEFMVDEKSAIDAIRDMVKERANTKRKRLSDIRKLNVISFQTIVQINNEIMKNNELTPKQKLIKLEILDEIVSLGDTLSINKEQLDKILKIVGS